jgi:Ca2+-binding EF-hand superfamily protein
MKTLVSHILLPLAGALLGLAQVQETHEKSLPDFLKRFDTNEDGKIDEEERQAIADLRAKLHSEKQKSIDSNLDGQIQKSEVEFARRILRSKIDERRQQKFREIAGEDNLISRDEFATIPGSETLPEFISSAIFEHLDTDDSGEISFGEFLGKLRDHDRLLKPAR